MSKVLILGNHSPEQLITWMTSNGLADMDDFTIVPFGKKLNPKKVKSYSKNIILLNYRCALNNFKVFNDSKFKNKNLFLFVPPFRGTEFTNAVPLDYSDSKSNPGLEYSMHQILLERFNQESQGDILREKSDYRGKVIDTVQAVGTILAPLMTLIYTLNNSVMQRRVTHALCTWMYEGQDEETLDRIFDNLKSDISISQKKRDRFKELLLSEVGENIRQALEVFREAKQSGTSASTDQVATKFGVQAYDLRYIKKVVSNGANYNSKEKITLKEFQKQELAKHDEVVEEVAESAKESKPKTKKKSSKKLVKKKKVSKK